MKKLLIFLLVIVISISALVVWTLKSDPDRVPILSYYRVNDIDHNETTLSVEQFGAQMKYLSDEGYTVITPTELLDAWQGKAGLPAKPIVLTFDDGHVDIYKNIFPILQKYNFKATFFIVTDYVNLYPDYLTWQQAREMQESGLVDIESNTLSQKDLTKVLDHDKLWDQIYGSKQAIEWYLKKSADFIAYPFSVYDLDTEDMSKQVGYRAAFISNYGITHADDRNSYIMQRIPIYGSNSHTFLRFQLRLEGVNLFAPIEHFKARVIEDGNGFVADFIPTP